MINLHNPNTSSTVTFDEWKERQAAGKPVDKLQISELELVSGLVYGRVRVSNTTGWVKLAKFHIDPMSLARSAAQVELNQAFSVSGVSVPEGPMMAYFMQDDTVQAGGDFNLALYDPFEDKRRRLKMEAVAVSIAPYALGEGSMLPVHDINHSNEAMGDYLNGLWRPTA